MHKLYIKKIKTLSKGYISLILFSYFLLFTILILNINYLLLSQVDYLHSFVDYVYSYAEALSGLRASNELSNISPITQIALTPTLNDFSLIDKITVENFQFKLLKTATNIYSFSQKNDSICILSARYRIENSIMLLSELSYYFRR